MQTSHRHHHCQSTDHPLDTEPLWASHTASYSSTKGTHTHSPRYSLRYNTVISAIPRVSGLRGATIECSIAIQKVAGSNLGQSASRKTDKKSLPWASCSHACAFVTKQYNSVPANGQWRSLAGKVTAPQAWLKVMAAYCRVDGLKSPAGWLTVHQDQLRAQRSVTSMGELYSYLLQHSHKVRLCTRMMESLASSSSLVLSSRAIRG